MSQWWLHSIYEDLGAAGVFGWVVWVIGSIVLHELAHGWAAIWQGDDTPRRLGRMTWNPLVHMGHVSLLIFAVAGIAWGKMPINPYNFRRWGWRWGDIAVTFAGPLMNIALAIVATIGLALWYQFGPEADHVFRNGWTILYLGIWLNILLAMFNLLPIPPLDGGHIASSLIPAYREFFNRPEAMYFSIGALIIFFVTPLSDVFFDTAGDVAGLMVKLATAF